MHSNRRARIRPFALTIALLAVLLSAQAALAAAEKIPICHLDETMQPAVYVQLFVPVGPAQNHLANHS